MKYFVLEKYIYKTILAYLLFVALSPLIFRGGFYIEIHDNLDSSIAWLASMNHTGSFFSPQATLPFLGGLFRNYLPSELQLNNLIFSFFEPLTAYIIAYLLKVVIGFFSFMYLMKVLKIEKDEIMPVVALLFSLLPGFPNLYFAQASLPLIFALSMRYIQQGGGRYLIFVFLYPMLSELVRYGLFLIGYSLLFAFVFLFTNLKYSRRLLVIGIVLSVAYLMTEYHFIYTYIFSEATSIRSEFVAPTESVIKLFIRVFVLGQYHAGSIHFVTLILIPLYALAYFKNKVRLTPIVIIIFSLILFNSLVFSLYDSAGVGHIISRIIPPLKGWNYSRVIWFNPLLWSVLFLILLKALKPVLPRYASVVILMVNVAIITICPTYNNDFSRTIRCKIIGCSSLSYEQFLSTDTFEELKAKLNYQGENVVAFGFHPSVLVFNKFTTLDMYHNAYDLDFKNNFRKLIEPTLSLNDKWREYYDNWGARAYMYPVGNDSCWSPLVKNKKNQMSCNLNINLIQANDMGLKYIISSYKLNNEAFHSVATVSGETYDLYAYAIK